MHSVFLLKLHAPPPVIMGVWGPILQGAPRGEEQSPRKLNILAHLRVNFACNFAHVCSEDAKKLVSLLQLQMPVQMYPPYAPLGDVCPSWSPWGCIPLMLPLSASTSYRATYMPLVIQICPKLYNSTKLTIKHKVGIMMS